jgi:DNA-3-methyladenine glycosylase II
MRKALNHLKKCDPVLAAIIEKVGPCRIEYGPAEFSSLAEAIVYQQLNGKAAVTIFNRFAALAGEPLTPEGILKLSDEQLRSVGLSKQKSSYLKDLAAKTAAGQLDFSKLPDLPDDEVIKHLTQVKGIGVWTAHMFLMFSLRRPDVLPTGDYGVQMAIRKHYKKRKLPKTWKRSPGPGRPTAALPAGTCGGAWTSRPSNHRGHRGPQRKSLATPASPVFLCALCG